MEENTDRGRTTEIPRAFGLTSQEISGQELSCLKRLVDRLAEKRAEHQSIKAQASAVYDECEQLESSIRKAMEAGGLQRFDGDLAAVSLVEKTSVKIPRDQADREAFFNYLREQGIFDQLISVNSQTLNSWWKQEVEVRRAKGLSEEIPGIKDISVFYNVQVRKK